MEASADYLLFLGRRTERLLLLGAVLVGLALVAFYFSAAAAHFSEDSLGRGLEDLALLVEGDQKPLQTFFDLERQREKLAAKKKDGHPAPESFSRKALAEKIVKASVTAGVEAERLEPYIDVSAAPVDIVRVLRERKSELLDHRASSGAMHLPSLFSVQAGGAAYRIPSSFIAGWLAIVLGPLIIGWLGALQITRQRERMLIARRDPAQHAFPHLLNMNRLWPGGLRIGSIGRITPEQLRLANRAVVLCARTTLVGALVAPLIGAYAATLLNLGAGHSFLLAVVEILAVAVMIAQATALAMTEATDHDFETAVRLTAPTERRSGTYF